MRRRNFLRLGSGEAIGDALAACGVSASASSSAAPAAASIAEQLAPPAGIVRGWNQLALRALRDTQSAASTSARALAALHTCMYNAWAAYDANARQTMHGRAVRLPRAERGAASKAGAISHAAYIVLCDRFPSCKAGFDAQMAGLGLDPLRSDAQFTPAGIGRTQATAMLDFCRRHGADSPDTPDAPIAGLPFALVPPDQLRPANLTAAPITAAQAAGGVASHWCTLAQQLSERGHYDEDRDVLLYFVLANALADAAIAGADADAAAAVALRGFTGSGRFGAGSHIEAAEQAGLELGREVGARVFEKARRYWQGKL